MRQREISPSEYGVEQHYPPRLRWHVSRTLEGLYGMVLKDMRSLPVVHNDVLTKIEETYKYLTYYYEEGVTDPDRDTILRSIGINLMIMLRENAAHIEMTERPNDSRCRAVELLRAYKLDESHIGTIAEELSSDKELSPQYYFEQLDRLFNLLWTTLLLPPEQFEILRQLLNEDKLSPLVAQSIASALFIGTMEYFDHTKIDLLLLLWTRHYDPIVRGAALASLLILGRSHQEELYRQHPRLIEDFRKFIASNEPLLLEALKVIQVAYKTADNHKIFKAKILPELRNISDKLREVMGGGTLSQRIDELQKGMMDKEKLSEIEELMAKAPDRLSIIQDKEQDAAYHLVTELKGFAFFSKISHWFLRFDKRQPDLNPANVEAFERLLPFMTQGTRMISSDLYSYALVPTWKDASKSIEAELVGQPMPQMSSLSAPTEIDGVRELVFGAYRFYTLSSYAHTMVSPFAHSPYLLDGAFLSDRGTVSEEGLLKTATIMVRFGQYATAGRTYERVVADYMTNTAEVWRGMAVASIMHNDNEKALQQLRNAVTLEGLTPMTARKIGEMLSRLGRPDEAVSWLEECERELEDHRLPLLRAKILHEMERNEEALKAVYKANYLSEDRANGSTPLLVELLLLAGKADEAKTALERESQEGNILFWQGLVSFALGKHKLGFEYLAQWMAGAVMELSLLRKLYLLEQYGYSTSDRALIEDIVYSKQ